MNFLRLLFRNRLAGLGAITLGLILLLVPITPLLPLPDPNATATADRFLRPFSEGHLLGTDHLGRDILARLLHGTRVSLAIGLVSAFLAAFFGSAIGIIAGYFGGRTDNLIMRLIDMLMAFPYILLALAIVAAVNVPFFARNIRGITVSLAGREFIDAARLAGLGHTRIITSELLPNVLPVIVIGISTTVGWMILETAGLSFLGLGSQPPNADLGSMLGEARAALITAPHTSIVPGIMIFLIVMSINLLGDGVRDALDPRLKSGALSRPRAMTLVDRKGPVPVADQKGLLNIQSLETQFHVGPRIYRAVNQVSLHLNPGECLGIIGESGSGKSVTALSVMGLVASPPGVTTGGAVRYGGEDLLDASYESLRSKRGDNVAYIFQDPLATLHPLYKIGDQLVEAIQSHHRTPTREARAKALELLKAVASPMPKSDLTPIPMKCPAACANASASRWRWPITRT